MAGRGELSDVEQINNDKCYMLRMARWQPMIEPVNVDRPLFGVKFPSGVSLAASFADELSRYFDAKVGLIPCADGGTSVKQWMPGEPLFDHAVMMSKLAMRISRFGGIIWHQGETDWDVEPELYKEKLRTVMTSLRRELNAENTPLILGELSLQTDEKWGIHKTAAQLNRVIHELASELPNCSVACADGLGLKPDGIHFNSVALREFGKRYFTEYKNIFEDLNKKETF